MTTQRNVADAQDERDDRTMTSATESSAVATDSTDDWRSLQIWEDSGFLAFLAAHEIKRSDLLGDERATAITTDATSTERRFFRVKQQEDGSAVDAADVVRRVTAELAHEGFRDASSATVTPVSWLPGFYALPVAAPLARLALYRNGDLYGIDISSGFAVAQLDVQPGNHVLDLCCAPGAKLAMIADLLQQRGSVTGVDCSRQRISACKQLVYKYQLDRSAGERDTTRDWRCRLFCADGRTFCVGPRTEHNGSAVADSDDAALILDTHEIASRSAQSQHRKRMNKSARSRERKRQRLADVEPHATMRDAPLTDLYDKVLVDAECTHDGSIRHLQRLATRAQWCEYVTQHLNADELERIHLLQTDLIRNGYRLLRPGGVMIYSTCSLSIQQNEGIVTAFLQAFPCASLERIAHDNIPCEAGRLPGTVRFTPAQSTSGLFIAKIRKAVAAGSDVGGDSAASTV